MSKGSRIICFRLTAAMDAAISARILQLNRTRSDTPYTTSSWIVSCIAERLQKQARAKKAGRKRRVKQTTLDTAPVAQ